jgi:hypothetical protein
MQRAACYAQGRANLGDLNGILSALINEPFDFPYQPQRRRCVCAISVRTAERIGEVNASMITRLQ